MVSRAINTDYSISMQISPAWQVGYHVPHDMLFLYRVDSEDLCWIFFNGVLDGVAFAEYVNFTDVIVLGAL